MTQKFSENQHIIYHFLQNFILRYVVPFKSIPRLIESNNGYMYLIGSKS